MIARGKLTIYGCGGAGVNATLNFDSGKVEPGQAEIKCGYVDTSRSNLRAGISEDQVYILPNVDGSGKVRAENHVEIANTIKQILVQIEPGDFNVCVFSASGGKLVA